MLSSAVFFVSLALCANAISIRNAAPQGHKHIVPSNVPYKQRCPVKKATFMQITAASVEADNAVVAKFPGTGMSPEGIKAEFAAGTVYKDGYYSVGCIKDYMFYKGDKFGDNKYDYEIEKISNVSIVFPLSYVAKEDQEPMTVNYCYGMCRQLKNMNFFGIVNGRDCYCAPYVKPMAGEDSTCTAVCDGDKGAICGSKTKSSVFQMHSCDDTSSQLSNAVTLFGDLQVKFNGILSVVEKFGSLVDEKADRMKAVFGQVGDPEASNLGQAAEGVGSKLTALATKAKALGTSISQTDTEASSLTSANFEIIENAAKADAVMTTMAEQTTAADKLIAEMAALADAVSPPYDGSLNATGAAKQYYPIMYFVDKKFEKSPTSCSGELMATYLGVAEDDCAKTCDSTDVSGCLGFMYVPGSTVTTGSETDTDSFCFTFSKITGAQYYTKEGCAASETMCYGKLSKLSGSSPLDKEKGQKAVEADSRCMPATV